MPQPPKPPAPVAVVVISPFGPHAVGALITGPDAQAVLSSEQAFRVVRVAPPKEA